VFDRNRLAASFLVGVPYGVKYNVLNRNL